MVKKYTKDLEERNICPSTGETWSLDDVPTLWRKKVEKQVLDDGYIILDDGTVEKFEEE